MTNNKTKHYYQFVIKSSMKVLLQLYRIKQIYNTDKCTFQEKEAIYFSCRINVSFSFKCFWGKLLINHLLCTWWLGTGTQFPHLQYVAIITVSIFCKILTTDTPYFAREARYGCLLWVRNVIYVLLLSLYFCMWYHDILHRVITALDCIVCLAYFIACK